MAITAAFDLDTMQLDSVNAFVNSVMDEVVYCEFPDGYPISARLVLTWLYTTVFLRLVHWQLCRPYLQT
jgi:hypothetical protein